MHGAGTGVLTRSPRDVRTMGSMTTIRRVSSRLEITVNRPTVLDFQITVARNPGAEVEESLTFTRDGEPVDPVEITALHGSRIHRLTAPEGAYVADYSAVVAGEFDPLPASLLDETTYCRPSRYAENDRLLGFAYGQFAGMRPGSELLDAVARFVSDRLYYTPGASKPIDGAVDTLLANNGVCRDFAHLTVGLLRALNVPARFVAVYAPGLDPMDFHAVAEALVDGQWHVVDPTGLGPRHSLVRMATGRDAADTAFLENHAGHIRLNRYRMNATIDGELPTDDGHEPVLIR